MTTEPNIAERGYQYSHGDRPLDGYTIQRAAGRGGFGEVYYALSDSGREVALKLVLTYEQIELRGISQCMNLKSPQLVTIFDVKYGTDGRPWVIMEFVAGPSLKDLIDASPAGLGPTKAAFFIREIGKGLTYLHDCGIVHRDLKPGNIFYEDGYVKIGDYGLSKTMSMTRHSGQTVAVGTLHYMAPEIGEGNYDRTIDIYAMGALLFEMLTGQVPFHGSSPAEVLMKHLTSAVDLSGVEEPFQSVIRKAMAKNPADRYQSAQEMIEAIYGSEQVRNSVSQFSPASLTQVAGRASPRVGAPPEQNAGGQNWQRGQRNTAERAQDPWLRAADRFTEKMEHFSERVNKFGERIAEKFERSPGDFNVKYAKRTATYGPGSSDPLTPPGRFFMAFVAMALAAFIAALAGNSRHVMLDALFVASEIIGAVMGARIAWQFIGESLRNESKWVQRLAVGGAPAGVVAGLVSFPFWTSDTRELQPAALACFGTMLLMDWSLRLSPVRKHRLAIGCLFTCGICALILAGMSNLNYPLLPIAAVTGASASASLLCLWGRRYAARPSPQEAAFDGNYAAGSPTPPPIPTANDASPQSPPAQSPMPQPSPAQFQPPVGNYSRGGNFASLIAPVVFWLLFFSFAANGHSPSWFGLVFMILAIVFSIKAFKKNVGGSMYTSAAAGYSDYSQEGSAAGRFASAAARSVMSIIGSMLLMLSLFLVLAVATDLGELFRPGVTIDPNSFDQISQGFGTTHWPRIMQEIAAFACLPIGTVAVVLILLARRRRGAMHMLRALSGIFVMLIATLSLAHALPHWAYVVAYATPGDTFDHYLQQIDFKALMASQFIFLIGALLFIWPARRRMRFPAPTQPQPVQPPNAGQQP